MRIRILAAVVGVPFLLAVIFFAPHIAIGCIIGILAAIAAYEFLRGADPDRGTFVRIAVMIIAAAIPAGAAFEAGNIVFFAAIFILMLFGFMVLIASFERDKSMTLGNVMAMFFAGGMIPLMFSSLVRLGAGDYSRVNILLPFVISITCDSGAYFAGVTIGKHKLAPRVSPNKTLEGSAGGFLCGTLCTMLYGWILTFSGYQVNFILLACYGFLGSLVCQIGDLSFSVIKRLVGIKDYGNIIPGHGGVLDRFDSAIFVAPLVELLMMWVPAIWK